MTLIHNDLLFREPRQIINNHTIPVEAIQERDIDLLLLEELSTDNTFCEWFTNELNLPVFNATHYARRSISELGLGETDILFSYQSGDKTIYVLIENKLDASFQFEQFDRYAKRAQGYLTNSHCHEAYCILVAPQQHCRNQSHFESYVSYEQIAARLAFTGGARNLFKSELLKIASEKLRRGYQPVNSEPVQRFWHAYWNYKNLNYPELVMKRPEIVPQDADWLRLYDARLNGVTFIHKLSQGNVDVTFRGFPEDLEFRIKENLPENCTIAKHSKSFSIRIFSGVIDRTQSFESQIDKVETAFQNIVKLRNWIVLNGWV